MFSSQAQVISAAQLADGDLDESALDPAKIVSGNPQVLHKGIYDGDDVTIGIWQHGVGVSIEIEAGPTLEVGPGDIGTYPPGSRTTWTVHEPLRKVYVVRP